MLKIKILGVVLLLALVAAACGGDDGGGGTTGGNTTGGGETAATGSSGEGPLAQYGESTDADPALVEKAMGDVSDVPDIVLASIARADQDLDQATIDKALECYTNAVECDTVQRAVELAAAIPDARFTAVEVRPVMDDSGLEM